MRLFVLLLPSLVLAEHLFIACLDNSEKWNAFEQLYWRLTDPDDSLYGQWLSKDRTEELLKHPQLDAFDTELREDSDITVLETFPSCIKASSLRMPTLETFQAPVNHLSMADSGRQPEVVRPFSASERSLYFKSPTTDQNATPSAQRQGYNMPSNQKASNKTNFQAVWGPGTYGFLKSDLSSFYEHFDVDNDVSLVSMPFFTGSPGGDNFGEASLDTEYISSLGNGVKTFVLNTNESKSTEEGLGFGYAMMDWLLAINKKDTVPFVVSLSLGSLSFRSCEILCEKAQEKGVEIRKCQSYMQTQRQVCMYDSLEQQHELNHQLAVLGSRGVSIMAAAGDGGSHFSFKFFPHDDIGKILNQVSCAYNFPTFPSASPFVTAVGGSDDASSHPVAWKSGGSGFSWEFPAPKFQTTAVSKYLEKFNGTDGFPPPTAFNSSGRAYPDVSAVANHVPILEQGQVFVGGGTSCSAPEFSGLISQLNDIRLNSGWPSLGPLNQRIYKHQGEGNALFTDITQGNSKCAIDSCCDTGFPAAQGWDADTGWGSPNWVELKKALATDK